MATAVKKTVSLPPELARQVEEMARAEGKSVSAVMQDALRLAQREYHKREYQGSPGLLERQGTRKRRSHRQGSQAVSQGLRVVFDTNNFVSAIVLPGSRAVMVLDELLGVLARKFSRDTEELSRIAIFLSELAEFVRPRRRITLLADDADNRVLECASTGRADAIVTGDQAMLALHVFEGVRVLTLRQYIDS